MNTFLPYYCFKKSASVLDRQRLGKQRVEAMQILNLLLGKNNNPKSPYRNHPCIKMWKNYENALGYYMNCMIKEWVQRGYKNNMKLYPYISPIRFPWWVGLGKFHASHRSNLKRKDPLYYSKFNWTEPNNFPYFWPGE